MAAPRKPNMKLVVLGEVNAGKTQLVRRYLGEEFEANSEPTVGFVSQRKTLPNGERMSIYDQAGNEQHLDLIDRETLQTADGILLVFDLSDCDRILTRRWMDVARGRSRPYTPIVLVGNKADLPRSIERAAIENMTDDLNAYDYFETSALNGDNVRDVFTCLIDAVHERDEILEDEPQRQQQPLPQQDKSWFADNWQSAANFVIAIAPTLINAYMSSGRKNNNFNPKAKNKRRSR